MLQTWPLRSYLPKTFHWKAVYIIYVLCALYILSFIKKSELGLIVCCSQLGSFSLRVWAFLHAIHLQGHIIHVSAQPSIFHFGFSHVTVVVLQFHLASSFTFFRFSLLSIPFQSKAKDMYKRCILHNSVFTERIFFVMWFDLWSITTQNDRNDDDHRRHCHQKIPKRRKHEPVKWCEEKWKKEEKCWKRKSKKKSDVLAVFICLLVVCFFQQQQHTAPCCLCIPAFLFIFMHYTPRRLSA